jgi:hypothetical protein
MFLGLLTLWKIILYCIIEELGERTMKVFSGILIGILIMYSVTSTFVTIAAMNHVTQLEQELGR